MRQPRGRRNGITRPEILSAYAIYQNVKSATLDLTPIERANLLFGAAFLALFRVRADEKGRAPLAFGVSTTAYDDAAVPTWVDDADDLVKPEYQRNFLNTENAPGQRLTPGTNHRPQR